MRRESTVQSDVRLAASYQGCTIWRNNTGAYQDEFGRQIRYGLCNDSKELNRRIKSSDLVGITPVVITPAHVGRFLGVFTAIEVKEEGWTQTPGDKRAEAQAQFHKIVKDVGGFAGFATSVDDFMRIIGRSL